MRHAGWFFIFFLLLTTPNSFANSVFNKYGYNLCVSKIFGEDRLFEFMKEPPERQAHVCFDILKKSHPEVAENIDFEEFKKGFYEGRYRKAHN